MDLKETYNLMADEWTDGHYGSWGQESINKFVALFLSGSEILDLGCGSGIRSKVLSDAGLKVLGIDFAEKMIVNAGEKVPNAEFKVLDIREIQFLKKKFDGVFAMAILLHFTKKEIPDLLNNIMSIINDGGYLYLTLKEQKGKEKDEKIIRKDVNGIEMSRFFSLFKLGEIKRELEKINMEIVYEEILKMRSRNWIILIARKI